jgi:guanylate kinase
MSGTLYVVAAPSGAGKTTLVRLLLKEERSVHLSISTTTRDPRPGEMDGREYHFVNVADFRRKIDGGEFLEWAEVHGNFYGTSKKWIADQLARCVRSSLALSAFSSCHLRLRNSNAG